MHNATHDYIYLRSAPDDSVPCIGIELPAGYACDKPYKSMGVAHERHMTHQRNTVSLKLVYTTTYADEPINAYYP